MIQVTWVTLDVGPGGCGHGDAKGKPIQVTLITPHIGRKPSGKYIRTWQMEPLGIATLAGATPSDVELTFLDERMEPLDFETPADLVAITVETYTAKRAYEIAAEYRKRGVPVVLGGYHPTLLPSEARRYADSIVVGFAEGVWEQVLHDAEKGQLQPCYSRNPSEPLRFAMPRREIYGRRPYLKVNLVETGRGCPATCDFCAISAFTQAHFLPRPVEEVVEEIRSLQHRTVFFVDDNIVGDFRHARSLLQALVPLKIRWFSQGTLNLARDPELLDLMQESGCFGLLIGFESLRADTLKLMNKGVNLPLAGQYREAVRDLHRHGIALYGAFVFGYDSEEAEDFDRTVEEAIQLKLYIAAFNHLVPFPGTPLYEKLRAARRLLREDWWLDPNFGFGDVPFTPKHLPALELAQACINARQRFFSWRSALYRAGNLRANLNSWLKAAYFVYFNGKLRQEISERRGLPLGNLPQTPKAVS